MSNNSKRNLPDSLELSWPLSFVGQLQLDGEPIDDGKKYKVSSEFKFKYCLLLVHRSARIVGQHSFECPKKLKCLKSRSSIKISIAPT